MGVSENLLQRLAQQAGFILAVDSGANWAYRAGLGLNGILGDLDSIDAEALKYYDANGVPVIEFDRHKEAADIELAFDHMEDRGFEVMVATNMLGGRFDHALASLAVFAKPREYLPWIIDDVVQVIILQADGAYSEIALDRTALPESGLISLIPLGGSAVVTAKGVEWPLEGEELLPFSSRGLSNVAVADQISIEVHGGVAAVVIPG
jgi:thiamine pyrophosphokinase